MSTSRPPLHGWIGVDLDATLAHYGGWRGGQHIGAPIEPMIARVRAWIAEGREVRVFTARASDPEQIPPVRAWLDGLGLTSVGITNVKDFAMVELWDDWCVQVQPNTGIAYGPSRIDGDVHVSALDARLHDLVRHQRGALHEAGLITDAEYAALASDHGAVARLEGYDAARDQGRRAGLAEAATFADDRASKREAAAEEMHAAKEYRDAALYRAYATAERSLAGEFRRLSAFTPEPSNG